MDRRWVGFAVVSVVLGLVLMAALAPDVGPTVSLAPVAPVAPVQVAAPAPDGPVHRGARRAGGPDAPDFPTTELGEDEGFDAPMTRHPEPPRPIDPDQVFTADLNGLAGAAVSRRDELVSCIHAYQQQTGDQGYEGRFTLKITVSPGEGSGALSTEVVNGPDDEQLYQCLDRAMGDARFQSPDHPTSVMWPIPLVGPDDLPDNPP